MKTWQVFLLGVAALIVVLFLPVYERALAGIGAFLIVAAVVAGFVAHPRRDVYHIKTTTWVATPDDLSREHDCIAVRVEVARFWLLFIPTFLAVSFLVVAATQGLLWNFSLIDRFADGASYVLFFRVLLVVIWGVISTWVSERWILHNADAACSANSVSFRESRVSYSFIDQAGEYYGGEGIAFGLLRPMRPKSLASLVFYNQTKPQQNKIAIECLFHRLTIVGRGLTDLDEATVAAHLPSIAVSADGAL
jgi:hypothetical protein